MFEAQVAYYLNEYLGKYVQGIDRESLNISIYAGDVILRNLRLKPDALEELDLPVHVHAGMLGMLRLKVPWNNLGGTPVIVEIDNLYLLARPRSTDSTCKADPDCAFDDVGLFEQGFQKSKIARISLQEKAWVKNVLRLRNKKQQNTKGFLRGLIDTVISNLQVSINNIHVRYEDAQTRPNQIFACGFTLQQLSAFTVDESGDQAFVPANQMDDLRKSLELKRAAIYFDCNTTLWSPIESWDQMEPGEWKEWFEPGIRTEEAGRSYVIQPVNGRASYVRRWKDLDQEQDAATELNIDVKSISADISRDQYCNYSLLLSEISQYTARLPYAGFVPHCRPEKGGKARAWWIYLLYVYKKNSETRKFTWRNVLYGIRVRSEYISMYKRSLRFNDIRARKGATMPDDSDDGYRLCANKISEMETNLQEATILIFRKVAHAEYNDELSKEAEQAKGQQKGWLGWLTGSTSSSGADISLRNDDETLNISNEEYDKILGVLEAQEELMRLKSETPYTILSKYIVNVGSVSLNLVGHYDLSLFEGSLTGIKTEFISYPITKEINVHIMSMGIDSQNQPFVETGRTDDDSEETKTNALIISFIKSPQDERSDAVLNMELAPSYVYYDPLAVGRVVDFFQPPEELLLQDLGDISMIAASQISRAKQAAAEYAVAAWSGKPKLEMRLTLNAPKLSFPSKLSDRHLAVDLGLFIIETDDNSRELSNHEKGLYECIKVTGSNISACLMGPTVDWGSDFSANNANSQSPLLEQSSLEMVLQIARYPDEEYPLLKVRPTIPKLQFLISPQKMDSLMQVLQNISEIHDPSQDRSPAIGNDAYWLSSSDWMRDCLILEWSPLQSNATWRRYQVVLYHATLYALKIGSPSEISYQLSITSDTIVSKLPESIIGDNNIMVIHNSKSKDWKEILRSSSTWAMKFDSLIDLQACFEEVNASLHKVNMQFMSDQISGNGSEKVKTNLRRTFVDIEGKLLELQIVVSGCPPNCHHDFRDKTEVEIVSLEASEGLFKFQYGDDILSFSTSLMAMCIEDLLMKAITGEARYIAKSDAVVSESNQENLAEFRLTVLSPSHPEYIGVQTSLKANFGSFYFFCSRPTVAALIAFGSNIVASSNTTDGSHDNNSFDAKNMASSASEIVLYCKDYTSKTFSLDAKLRKLQLFLCYEYGGKLADASVSDFHFTLENISDGRTKINASLGNLNIYYTALERTNQYSHICGVRDVGKSSLVMIQFEMYPAHVPHLLNAPQNMICYSLDAHLSKLKVVFLYRFIQECMQYLSQMLEFRPQTTDPEFDECIEDSKSFASGESSILLLLNISMDAPLITIPHSSDADESMKADLGTVSLSNKIVPSDGQALVDHSLLHLNGLQLYPSSTSRGDGQSLVDFSEEGWLITWTRPLDEKYGPDVAKFEIEIEISELEASLSSTNLANMIDIFSSNVSEEVSIPENALIQKNQENAGQQNSLGKRDSTVSQKGSLSASECITFRCYISLQHLQLNLYHENAGGSRANLSYVQIDHACVSYTSFRSGNTIIDLSLPKLEISDIRPHVPPEHSLVISSGQRASLIMLNYCSGPNGKSLDVILQKPLVVLELGFLSDLTAFFVPQFSFAKSKILPFISGDITFTDDELSLSSDIWLSPAIRLLADAKPGKYCLNGNGHSIFLPNPDFICDEIPLIMVGSRCSLELRNVRIVNSESLDMCVKLGAGASLCFPVENDVVLINKENEEKNLISSNEGEKTVVEESGFVFTLKTSNLGLYLLQKRAGNDDALDQKNIDTKLISFKTDLDLLFSKQNNDDSLSVELRNLRASQSNISNLREQIVLRSNQNLGSHKKLVGEKESTILLPLKIAFGYKSTISDIDFDLSISDANILISPGVLESVSHYIEDAVAPLQQPGPENPASVIGKYQKIASIHSKDFTNGGMCPEGLVTVSNIVTFWRPRSSTGCLIAGDVITSGNRAPSFEVVSLSKNSGLVAHPQSFDNIFSSKGIDIWIPLGPKGYSSIGLFATVDGKPPALEDVCCIADAALIHAPKGEKITIVNDGKHLDLINVDNSFGSFMLLDDNGKVKLNSLDLRNPIGPTTYALSELPFGNILIEGTEKNFKSMGKDLQKIYVDAQSKKKTVESRSVNCPKTLEFQRIWTDSGALSGLGGVSIWRPIAPLGCWILGDCFMNGFDPPPYVNTLQIGELSYGELGNQYLADPDKYELVWHDGNPKVDQRLSIWNPIAPCGYISMGSIASIGMSPPDVDVKCIAQQLTLKGLPPRAPLWHVSGDHMTINPFSVWRVDERTRCFWIDPTDSLTPPDCISVLNTSFIEKPLEDDPGRTINAVIRINSLNLTFYDSFRVPLLKSSIKRIESGIRGYSKEVVQSYGGFKPSLSAYNPKSRSWEPILESFDAILKVDANFTRQTSSGIDPGIHVCMKSSTEMILTTFALSHVNSVISSYEECMTALQRNEKTSRIQGDSILSDKWLRSSVIVNDLGVDIELETERCGEINLFSVVTGQNATISRNLDSDVMRVDSMRGLEWSGGMLLLDIESIQCSLDNDTRIAVAAYFEHDRRNLNPQTRALNSKDGFISFNERLVLTCEESKLMDAKCILVILDVRGNAGKGRIIDSGIVDLKGVSRILSTVTVSLHGNEVQKAICKACWQHYSVSSEQHEGKSKQESNVSNIEQRAVSIKGSPNLWNVIPELSRRVTAQEGKVLSVAAVQCNADILIIEGSVQDHLWHERFRSNCVVSNTTELSIDLSIVSEKGDVLRNLGTLPSKQNFPMPLGWKGSRCYLSISPNITIHSKSSVPHRYEWGVLNTGEENVCPGIQLDTLEEKENTTVTFTCMPDVQGSEPFVFSAHVASKIIQGTYLIDWEITIVPPIRIRNHVPLPISLSLYDGGEPLDCLNNARELKKGETLPMYYLGSTGSLQFTLQCCDYSWAERAPVALTGQVSQLRESVRICKEDQRIPSELYVSRLNSNGHEIQHAQPENSKCSYPLIITISSPLWILNKTDFTVEIASVSVQSQSKRSNQRLDVDYVFRGDPIYESVQVSSSENETEKSNLVNSRKIRSRSTLLSSVPAVKNNGEEKNISYGFKIRVQNSGWTEPLLFDKEFAVKYGYGYFSPTPLLILSESRSCLTVYGTVIYLESNEFNDSRILHIETQILLQNSCQIELQAFRFEQDNIPVRNARDIKNTIIRPKGGMHIEQASDKVNGLYSVKSFVHMPDNLLDDMLQRKAIFDIPADSISRPMNFSKFDSSFVCFRKSDQGRISNAGIWSRPIDLGKSDEGLEYIVVPSVSNSIFQGSLMLRISFRSRGPGLKLIVIESAECLPKSILVNKSPFMLNFSQVVSNNPPIHDLPPFSAVGYVAEFSTPSELKVEVFGPKLRSYSKHIGIGDDMDCESRELSISSSKAATISTMFESIHTLSPLGKNSLSGNKSGYSIGRGDMNRVIEVSSSSLGMQRSWRYENEEMEYFITFEVPGISVSFIDLKPQELALVTIEDIKIELDKILISDRIGTGIKFVAKLVQIDNQLPGTLLPVTLCKAIGSKSAQPMIDFRYSSFHSKNRSSIHLPYVGFRIPNKLQIAIEESLIWKIFKAYEYMTSLNSENKESKVTASVDAFVKMRLLSFGQAPLSVSFQNNPSLRPASLQDSSLSLILDLAAFKGANVKLRGFEMENMHTTFSEFTTRVNEKIKGELMSAGFSLVRTFGFVGGAQRLIGFLGAKAARFASGSESIVKKEVPLNEDLHDDVSFGSSVLKGFKGLVNKPIEGARAEGFEGAFKGVAKGVVGVFTAPVSRTLMKQPGTFDASFAQGRSSILVLQRKRLPRVLGAGGVIPETCRSGSMRESVLESLGQAFLWSTVLAESSKFTSPTMESYEEHFVLPDGFVLVFTSISMLHIYSPGFAAMDGAAEIGTLPAIEIPAGIIKWRISWEDLLAMELRWTDTRNEPDRLIVHRKGGDSKASHPDYMSDLNCDPLAQEILCFQKTPQASQIKFVGNRILSKYYRDPSRQDHRWALRHAARLALPQGASLFDFPLKILSTTFEKSWHTNPNRSPVVYFWKPSAPPGYKPVGCVATLGPDPPLYPVYCFRDDVTLANRRENSPGMLPTAFPEEYSLIWRFNGGRPVSMWMPVPPQGYVAMGAIIVGDATLPSMDDYVCLREDLVKQTPLFDSAIWSYNPDAIRSQLLASQHPSQNSMRLLGIGTESKVRVTPEPIPSYLPETWKVSVWQIDSPLMTLLVARGLKKPPQQLSFTIADDTS